MWDAIWINADLATMTGAGPYGAIPDGALAVEDGRIAWAGPASELDGGARDKARQVHDAGGRWITPGLIDCHSHLVYGGNRADEFEMRLKGASYQKIAAAGGGILGTVEATRAADEQTLLEGALKVARALAREGVTTLEIKSGYGLDLETEIKTLRVAGRVAGATGLTVKRTFLGAHSVPAEYAGRADDYLTLVCEDMIPRVAEEGLADAVDAFGESIAFSPGQVARVFEAARAHGLPVKLHADQLSDQGGAALAARFKALSADHLEYAGEDGLSAMAAAGTVAVLLPGAFYFLGETRKPPVAAMRAAGLKMAVATDSNPGSAPVASLLLMVNMACTLFGLSPEEALAGVTVNAARALGLEGMRGVLAPGQAADFVLWDISGPAELAYGVGANPCAGVVIGGAPVDLPALSD